MVLAEIEVFVSPPHAPTRRIAMGRQPLATDGNSGFAAVLIGAIVSRYWDRIDEETEESLDRLLDDVEAGRRLDQPRVRHRLQTDRVGLKRTVHRLVGVGDQLAAEVADRPGTPAQHLLAAAYTVAAMPLELRGGLASAFRFGSTWRGALDSAFVSRLTQRKLYGAPHHVGNVAWALGVLGLGDTVEVTDGVIDLDRASIMSAFRTHLLDAHPDHGADDAAAADRIAELAEARRILMSHR